MLDCNCLLLIEFTYKVTSFLRVWRTRLRVTQNLAKALKTVFPPERAIAGIPRYNQRWAPEKRKKGQFGPFHLQDLQA